MHEWNVAFLNLIDTKFSSILEMCEEACEMAGKNKFDYRVVLTDKGHINRICSTRGISLEEQEGRAITIHQFRRYDLEYLATKRFEEQFMSHFTNPQHCIEYVTWLNGRYPGMEILNCDFSLSTTAQNIVFFKQWHPDLFETYMLAHKQWIIKQECWQIEMKLLDAMYGIQSWDQSIVMMIDNYEMQTNVA